MRSNDTRLDNDQATGAQLQVQTGFGPNSLVTPNQFVRSPALLRVGRVPIIP